MNDHIAETTSSSSSATASSSATSLNRRHLIGGAVAGAAGLTLLTGGFVAAQSSTPDASSGTTERATGDGVKALIAAVQKDRDAVASSIETTLVDQLLSLATDLEAQSETATGSSATAATPDATTKGDFGGKLRFLGAAALVARSARADIVAQLTTYSLPSGQARVSQMLAKTHDAIGNDGPTITGKNITDAGSAVTFSQQLYALAYDAYGKALYAQAGVYGKAAQILLAAGAVLTGDLKDLAANGSGIGGKILQRMDADDGSGDEGLLGRLKERRQNRKNGSSDNSTTPAVPATPVAVPSPSF